MKKPPMRPLASLLVAVALLHGLSLGSAAALEPLPEGDTGIAARHPGDRGIAEDPAVRFADDFEASASLADLAQRWDVLINADHLELAPEAGDGPRGARSLQLRIPQQGQPLATGVAKTLVESQDRLFLRWYGKFEADWRVAGNSVHNGASISARYFVNGMATPGQPADGRNKFLVNFESENSVGDAPGHLNAYVYWPEQGDIWGDHFFPSGLVLPFSVARSGVATFGADFISRPDFAPEPGRWHCYEYMVQANTPGRRDGRIAMWLDGALIADFPNLRLRDIADLKIDRFGLDLYIADNSARANHKWQDNVVAATSYIGPIAAQHAILYIPAAHQTFTRPHSQVRARSPIERAHPFHRR